MGEIALRWASSLLPPGLSDYLPGGHTTKVLLSEHQYQEPDNVARMTHPSGDVEPV